MMETVRKPGDKFSDKPLSRGTEAPSQPADGQTSYIGNNDGKSQALTRSPMRMGRSHPGRSISDSRG
ncbi:hypothetical protein [Undibacterium terreum]|uniref:hypothetical protein n=1 Tax=Undibacterium terreum TaxID=1224302 RepID=UPI00166C53E8|nr:hypothetical protein [Undibacterium terreum]